jgi:hypothetical protein
LKIRNLFIGIEKIRDEGRRQPQTREPPYPEQETPLERLSKRFEEIIERQVAGLRKDFDEIKDAIREIVDERTGLPRAS